MLPKLPSRLYFCLALEYLAVTVRERNVFKKETKRGMGMLKHLLLASVLLKDKNKFPQSHLFQKK